MFYHCGAEYSIEIEVDAFCKLLKVHGILIVDLYNNIA